MNVLSLFDGISCGQIALNRIGFKYDNYYASEIDKYAIQVTQHNYPNTIQVGDVTKIKGEDLPKIDLLIGGSPCQSFSFVGKQKGMSTKDNIEILSLENYLELKVKGFEFEGQSYLFWEYMRMLNEIKPRYFLLENVKMSNKWKQILTKAINVEPILINSSLVSAQNRERLYWTNIPIKHLPKDKGIVLEDVIDKTFLNYKIPKNFELRVPPSNPKYCDPYNKKQIINKSTTLRTNINNGNMWVKVKDGYRNLTRNETEELQTIPKNYTSIILETKAKKCLSNGWTVDVISHIFSHIPKL